jgi:hypothetical protein
VEVSFIGAGNRSNRRKPPTSRRSLTNFITKYYIEYTSPRMVFELTTLVVIGTDYIGSYKSNYHTITTTTAPDISKIFGFFITIKKKESRIKMNSVAEKLSFAFPKISVKHTDDHFST